MAEKPQDFNLPANIVAKLIKDALPDDVQVSKDARAVLGKAASIFVLYSTAYASKIAEQNGRKNLTAQDVVEATDHLGFSGFVPEMKQVYQGNKRDKARQTKARQERRNEKKQQSLLARGDRDEEEEDDGQEEEDADEPSYEVVFE